MAASKDSPRIPAPPADGPSNPGAPGAAETVDPAALSLAQLARILGIPWEKVQEHVDAGAPTGPDGGINLVHYATWLTKEMGADKVGDSQLPNHENGDERRSTP